MYACFDLGGTSLKYGLLDETGKILENGKVKVHDDVELIFDLIEKLIKSYEEANTIQGV